MGAPESGVRVILSDRMLANCCLQNCDTLQEMDTKNYTRLKCEQVGGGIVLHRQVLQAPHLIPRSSRGFLFQGGMKNSSI